METENIGNSPFLDILVDIYRRPDGSLGHRGHCRLTHTHTPISTSTSSPIITYSINKLYYLPWCTAPEFSVKRSLQAEIVLLRDVFKQNGYNDRQVHRIFNRRPHLGQPDNSNSVAFLPIFGLTFNLISRVLVRHNVESVGLPRMTFSSLLRPVENNLGIRTPGVYRIPYEWSRFYIGQTGRSVNVWLKEHQRQICLERPEKSAVAEYSIGQGHRIQFHNTSTLTTTWTTLLGRLFRLISISQYELRGWFLSHKIMEASYLLPKHFLDITAGPLVYAAPVALTALAPRLLKPPPQRLPIPQFLVVLSFTYIQKPLPDILRQLSVGLPATYSKRLPPPSLPYLILLLRFSYSL
jgi:hypothetical protein